MNFSNMLGKPLASVRLGDGKEDITFMFQDGTRRAFGVEGDCCLHSWIEHLEVPPSIVGATILAVEESDSVEGWDKHICRKKEGTSYGNECGHDSLQIYNTTFLTARGSIVLEYRNDSNGYYGGNLVDLP